MHFPIVSIASLGPLVGSVIANPQVTAAAQLAPRQAGSDFVGYISQNGGYSESRTCNYPQTLSTSNGYVQCCNSTGSCPFFTSCSGNTLFAAGATVACDTLTGLACNTAIVEATAGASSKASYLACWQTSLGTNPFTFVQNIGSASATATSGTGVAASGNARSSSSGSRTGTATTTLSGASAASAVSSAMASAASSASSAASSAAATSKNSANHAESVFSSGILGSIVAFVVQVML